MVETENDHHENEFQKCSYFSCAISLAEKNEILKQISFSELLDKVNVTVLLFKSRRDIIRYLFYYY